MSEDEGLAFDDGRLVFGVSCGWGRCLPGWIKELIVTVWNFVACRIYGHDDFLLHLDLDQNDDGSYDCVDCLKRLRGCCCREHGAV